MSEDLCVWRRMWWPWPQLVGFLKSLCFWRYRILYLASLRERGELARFTQQEQIRCAHLLNELRRLRAILAPYGEKILTGQTRDDDFEAGIPVRLPPLEYEMAKAWFRSNARMTNSYELDLLVKGFDAYSWRGRPIQCWETTGRK